MPGSSDEGQPPSRSNYLDFELEIGPGRGREYPVAVLESPAGEARATMHFPFDELALENRLLNLQNALLRSGGEPRRTLSPEEQGVQDFGRDLFETLFTAEIRSCYDVSLREAAQRRKGLRLKLRIQPPELAALPWEYLYHPGQGEYVSLSTRTPVVRYLEVAQRIQPLRVTPPLRILGMIASPEDLPELDVTREKQRMEHAIRDLRGRGLAELAWLPGQTWRDLLRAMRGGPWHIFHFVGHGGYDPRTGEGHIALADPSGRAVYFNATRLGRLLADHASLRLVLLNSCEGARGSERDIFSSTAAVLVRRGIPAVLAMQYPITDRAAIEFARTFYEALGDGMPVDGAMAEARKAISFAVTNTVEWGTPVLYMRSPDGVLFDVAAGRGEVRPAPGIPTAPPLSAEELEQLYVDGLDALWSEEWDRACRSFQSIVDSQPDYRDAAANLQRAQQQKELHTLYAQACAAQESEDWAAALSVLEKLVGKAPGFKDAAVLLEMAKKRKRLAELYSQAQHLRRAERWGAVVKVFAQIAALDPKYPDPDGLLSAAQRGAEEEERQKLAVQDRPAPWQRLPRWALAAIGGLVVVGLILGGLRLAGVIGPVPTPTLAPEPTRAEATDTPAQPAEATDTPGQPTEVSQVPAYPVPVLDTPQDNAVITASSLALEWQWDGQLAADEFFDLRMSHEGDRAHLSFGWLETPAHRIDLTGFTPGRYHWSVVVIRARDGEMDAELSQESETWSFVWEGEPGPTDTPSAPTPTVTPALSPTPMPPTPTPTSTPTVALPILAGTPVPRLIAVISIDNAAQVRQLARWGKGAVEEVAYSPDGTLLAVASSLGLCLYDAETFEEVRVLETSAWVNSVAFSPDGATLASASEDGTVRLWRVSEGGLLYTLGHPGFVLSVAFSPDGTTLASGSTDNTVRLWRVSDGSPLRTLEGHGSSVLSVAFSPDGETLASGSWDNTVRLWRVSDGDALRTLEGHADGVFSVAFSPDGATLVSASRDGTVRLWRASDGGPLRTLEGHTGGVYSVAFSPDGASLASGSWDNTVRLWRASDGVLLQTLAGHTSLVDSVAFSPDGERLASGSDTVRLWRVSDGSSLHILEGYTDAVYSVVFSPDGETLAWGASDGTVRLRRASDGALLRTLQGHTDYVYGVAFSPDGETLASGSWDGTMRLWRASNGELFQILEGHTDSVFSVAFSPDGATLASGSRDRTVRLWRASDGALLHTLGGVGNDASVAFSPDGETLASGGWGTNTVRLWRVSDGELLNTLDGHASGLFSVAFSPDGETLASGSLDETARLWRVSDGALLHTLEGHTDTVYGVAFSPDGATLASASRDGTVRLWRVSDGELLHILQGHADSVNSVAFSPDGATLASGSFDSTVRLWGIVEE